MRSAEKHGSLKLNDIDSPELTMHAASRFVFCLTILKPIWVKDLQMSGVWI